MVKPNKIFLKINNNSIDLALSNRTPANKFQKFITAMNFYTTCQMMFKKMFLYRIKRNNNYIL